MRLPGARTTCSTKFVSMREGGTASGKMTVPALRMRVPCGASERTAARKLTLRGSRGGTTGSRQVMTRFAGS
jgi:hypothetical protein